MLVTFAKKTFLALKNPYHTVIKVQPLIIDEAKEYYDRGSDVYYVGVKNTNVIPSSFIKQLQKAGCFWHTVDAGAHSGRAVDISLQNPLTLRCMSGSSSGTALNVLYGINDIGIGSDGGGSILAPAACVNLFGFMSPLLPVRQMKKQSTDGIAMTPSTGVITREWKPLIHVLNHCFAFSENEKSPVSLVVPTQKSCSNPFLEEYKYLNKQLMQQEKITIEEMDYPDKYGDRKPLIDFLKQPQLEGKIVVSIEGPVDRHGIGDSIFGQFDETTKQEQRASCKGLLRVVNMAGKSAVIIPMPELGVGMLFICDSAKPQIAAMLEIARRFLQPRNALADRYFLNIDHHFQAGFLEE